MAMKNYFHKGKTFYATLRLLIVFINVPILIVLLLSQQALERSHETLRSILGTAQTAQMKYIKEATPGQNHTDQIAALREHPFLRELGEAEHLEYGPDLEQAEHLLAEVTPSSEYGQISTYLYFYKSGYLMDNSKPGGNTMETASQRTFYGFQGLDPDDTSFSRSYLQAAGGPNKADYTIYTAVVFPNVVFIFDIQFPEYPVKTRPDMSLSQDYTASLQDVELCYYDSYGNVRSTSGGRELIYQYDYDSLGPDCDHSFSFRHNGRFYLCHYVFRGSTMTKFALFCRDEIAEEQHRMSILIWVACGVLLLAFLACAFIYAQRAYKPIDSLISRLHKNENSSPPRDEFKAFHEALDLFDEQLNKRDRLLSKYYLLRVLRGQKTDMLEDFQDEWFSEEGDPSFAVAALHVDEWEGDALYDGSRLELDAAGFFRSEGWNVRTVLDSDFLYLAFRLNGETRNAGLMQAFQRLQKQLSGCCISVYLSDIHPCARELRRCCSEAMTISEYYIANEKIGIIAGMSSIPQASTARGTASPDFAQLRKLSDCITTLSAGDALIAFDELTFQLVQAGGQPLRAESTLYDLLVNTIALAIYDIDMPGETGRAAIQQGVNQVRSASGVAQLRQRLQECLRSLSKRSDGQEYHFQRFEKIRDYIQEHYADPDLDSASIAEHYNMSSSTLTRLFKKYNNTGFLEFVHQTRVRKAIELLQTTDLPISEISSLVGYTNAATMSRAFKAHAKSTPSMIRKLAQES